MSSAVNVTQLRQNLFRIPSRLAPVRARPESLLPRHASRLLRHGFMALHGFPRMAKDIDLLLPVDTANNRRLMEALKAVPDLRAAVQSIKRKWLDEGYSTAIEGKISVDLLFVAADRSFGDLRKHVKAIDYDGVPILTLDIDGMLITKDTTRESDRADRLKLQRLKLALAEAAKSDTPDSPTSKRKSYPVRRKDKR